MSPLALSPSSVCFIKGTSAFLSGPVSVKNLEAAQLLLQLNRTVQTEGKGPFINKVKPDALEIFPVNLMLVASSTGKCSEEPNCTSPYFYASIVIYFMNLLYDESGLCKVVFGLRCFLPCRTAYMKQGGIMWHLDYCIVQGSQKHVYS